jgi:hypothetical protein
MGQLSGLSVMHLFDAFHLQRNRNRLFILEDILPKPDTLVTKHSDGSKYIYCVILSRQPCQFTALGIGERGDLVNTVHFRNMAAVVSDTLVSEFEESRRNMMAHTLVLEEVMRQFTILPVRFGTVAPNTAAIQNVLEQRYDELLNSFAELEDRIELGVKAFWYEEVIFREIVESNPSIRHMRDGLMGRSAEETYYERIQLGEMIEAAMSKKREEDAEKILDCLRPLVHKSRANKVLTDKMVLNAAFLVNREGEAEFDQVMQHLDNEMGKRLMFKYVGPVPPYNFVNLIIHWNA